MIKINLANKSGLWLLFLERLYEAKKSIRPNSTKNYIPYNVAAEKVCRNFSITKQVFFDLLLFCREINFIRLSCGHGIFLNYEIKNNKLILKNGY